MDGDHTIADARRAVAGARLAHRVRPMVRDASDPELGGRFDLATIFEALHDMNHPIEALPAARGMLAEGGSVVIADERAAERFTAPGDEQDPSAPVRSPGAAARRAGSAAGSPARGGYAAGSDSGSSVSATELMQ